jgi:hypothetical protein
MTDDPHDTLAAEEFAIPAPDPHSAAAVPHDSRESPHDTLAAEAFAIPAPDPHSAAAVPHDPLERPHDTLAAEEFAIPAPSPGLDRPSPARRRAARAPLPVAGIALAAWLLARRRAR